ncbi:hypothetical protein, partial [Paenibacillus sp. Y412MC10]|uniref:hypothetical protein n=1 Tax=Geobacillus sp. (strain Y412MC10) TaxID=481743 RepID=UPI001C92EA49
MNYGEVWVRVENEEDVVGVEECGDLVGNGGGLFWGNEMVVGIVVYLMMIFMRKVVRGGDVEGVGVVGRW